VISPGPDISVQNVGENVPVIEFICRYTSKVFCGERFKVLILRRLIGVESRSMQPIICGVELGGDKFRSIQFNTIEVYSVMRK
jgi:hypothetical protein